MTNRGEQGSYLRASVARVFAVRARDLSVAPKLTYALFVSSNPSPLDAWTPQQLADARRWVEAWKLAGPDLERIRRQELRELDTYRAIELLCGTADYTKPPRAPRLTSGLVEQQQWFMRLANRE